MATFGDAEKNIQRLLAIGQSFVLSGVDYIIRKSGKPTCSKGEPKTDIYVLAESKDRALLVEIKYHLRKKMLILLRIKRTAKEQSCYQVQTGKS